MKNIRYIVLYITSSFNYDNLKVVHHFCYCLLKLVFENKNVMQKTGRAINSMSQKTYKYNRQIYIKLKWLLFTTAHVIPMQLKILKMSWIFKSQWVILNSCIVLSSGYSPICGVSKMNDERHQGNFFTKQFPIGKPQPKTSVKFS